MIQLSLNEPNDSILFTLYFMFIEGQMEYSSIRCRVYILHPIRYNRSQLLIIFVLMCLLKLLMVVLLFMNILLEKRLRLIQLWHFRRLKDFITVLRNLVIKLIMGIFHTIQVRIMHLFFLHMDLSPLKLFLMDHINIK